MTKDPEVISLVREARRVAMSAAKDLDPIGQERTRAPTLVARDPEAFGLVKEAKLGVTLVARDLEVIDLVKEARLEVTNRARMSAATAVALGQAILANKMTRLHSS